MLKQFYILLFVSLIFAVPFVSAGTCLIDGFGCETTDDQEACEDRDGVYNESDKSDLFLCQSVCVLQEDETYALEDRIYLDESERDEADEIDDVDQCYPDYESPKYTNLTLKFEYKNSNPVNNLNVMNNLTADSKSTNSLGQVTFSIPNSTYEGDEFEVFINWSFNDEPDFIDSCELNETISMQTGTDDTENIVLNCGPEQQDTDEPEPEEPDFPDVPDDEEGRICDPETGEFQNVECEPTNPPNFDGVTCSDVSGFSSGTLICDSNCNIRTEQCFACPSIGEAETACAASANTDICDECTTCADNSFCENYCAEDIVFNSLSGSRNLDDHSIKLNWSLPNTCTVNSLTVSRCEGVGCGDYTFLANTGITSESYIDSDVEPDMTYCYSVEMVVQEAQGIETSYNQSNVCVISSNPVCDEFEAGVPTCYEGDVVTCEGGITTTDECSGEGSVCTPLEEGAQCFAIEDTCDIAAGPFGSFGYLYNDLADAVGACYFDHFSYDFKSNAGSLDECSGITSCYDYLSQSSCESNDCDFYQECEWDDYLGEFGLGACMPENVEFRDCNECDDSIIGDCSQDLCEGFYGQQNVSEESLCFYNSEPDTSQNPNVADEYFCANVDEVACETYNIEVECLGDNGNFSVNAPNLDNLDSDSDFTLNEYDNSVEKLSEDSLDLSKCIWTSNSCGRDAASQRIKHEGGPDCRSDDLDCLTDFENPETKFVLRNGTELTDDMAVSKKMLREGSFNVTDNVYDLDDITTYYVFGNNKYPNIEVSNNKLNRQSLPEQGPTDLAYFSIDKARNIEEVNVISFDLAPELNISLSTEHETYYNESHDSFYTNLTGNITISSNSLDNPLSLSNCNINLSQGQTDFSPILANGENFTINNIPDGIYSLRADCIDNLGQTASDQKSIRLLGDDLMAPESPMFETVKPGDINLVLNARYNASECKIRQAGRDHEWINMSTRSDFGDGNITFNQTIFETNSDILLYDTACKFDTDNSDIDEERLNETGWFEGRSYHAFFFAVDADNPKLSVLDRNNNNENYTSSIYKDQEHNQANLGFECSWAKDDGTWAEYGFGGECNELRVCAYDENKTQFDCSFDDDSSIDISESNDYLTIFEDKIFELDQSRINQTQNWHVYVEAENEFGYTVNKTIPLGLRTYELPGGNPGVIIS